MTTIEVICPVCGTEISAKAKHGGKRFACPICHEQLALAEMSEPDEELADDLDEMVTETLDELEANGEQAVVIRSVPTGGGGSRINMALSDNMTPHDLEALIVTLAAKLNPEVKKLITE